MPRRITAKRVIFLAVLLLLVLALSAFTLFLFPREKVEEFAKYGYAMVFVATLLSSSTVLVPLPGIALELYAATIWNPMWIAVVASLGSALGEIVGYILGYGSRVLITPHLSGKYSIVEKWMRRYGGVTIFLLAFLPMPLFDLVGIAAGASRFPWWKFLLFCWAGKLSRSMIMDNIGAKFFRFIFF